MSRLDLNMWHLLARGGLVSKPSLDMVLLTMHNKNNWLPVHLSKNKPTAHWLYELTLNQGVSSKDIVLPALINNAQSIQTKYGQDLMDFLVEQQFSFQDAKNAALEPNTQSRIDLSLYWLSLVDLEYFLTLKEQNPIELAISYSNSYFFIALNQLINLNKQLYPIINLLITACPYNIGDTYLVENRAFQLQQILKQQFNIDKKINYHTVNGVINNNNIKAIEKLEGF